MSAAFETGFFQPSPFTNFDALVVTVKCRAWASPVVSRLRPILTGLIAEVAMW